MYIITYNITHIKYFCTSESSHDISGSVGCGSPGGQWQWKWKLPVESPSTPLRPSCPPPAKPESSRIPWTAAGSWSRVSSWSKASFHPPWNSRWPWDARHVRERRRWKCPWFPLLLRQPCRLRRDKELNERGRRWANRLGRELELISRYIPFNSDLYVIFPWYLQLVPVGLPSDYLT